MSPEYGGGCEALLRDASLPPTACCSSCHSDDEAGYESGNYELFQGKEYHVCCTVSAAFDHRAALTQEEGR